MEREGRGGIKEGEGRKGRNGQRKEGGREGKKSGVEEAWRGEGQYFN